MGKTKETKVTHRWKIRRWKLHKRRVHSKQKLRKCLVLSLSVIPFTIGDAIPNHQDIAWPVEDSVAMRRRHRNSNGVGSQLIYLYCWWPSHMSMTRVNNCTLVTCADPSKCWTPLISLCLSSKDYRKHPKTMSIMSAHQCQSHHFWKQKLSTSVLSTPMVSTAPWQLPTHSHVAIGCKLYWCKA